MNPVRRMPTSSLLLFVLILFCFNFPPPGNCQDTYYSWKSPQGDPSQGTLSFDELSSDVSNQGTGSSAFDDVNQKAESEGMDAYGGGGGGVGYGDETLDQGAGGEEVDDVRLQMSCGRRRQSSMLGMRARSSLGAPMQTDDANEDLESFADEPRIVGGQVSQVDRWPWQISLHYQNYHICGGSLVDARHIITAAHCFSVSRTPSDFSVYLGKSRKANGEPSEHRRSIVRIRIHPRYNVRKHDSDIAILFLDRPVQFSATVAPICLPRAGTILRHGMKCYVTGYGETKGTGGEGRLKEAVVPVIGNNQCRRLSTTYQKLLTENMICSGLMEGGVDSCQGDSGGPFVCETHPGSQIFALQGVVSFGIGCAARRSPGIYTRVSNFIPWIRRGGRAV